jgi:hypothetical protein
MLDCLPGSIESDDPYLAEAAAIGFTTIGCIKANLDNDDTIAATFPLLKFVKPAMYVEKKATPPKRPTPAGVKRKTEAHSSDPDMFVFGMDEQPQAEPARIPRWCFRSTKIGATAKDRCYDSETSCDEIRTALIEDNFSEIGICELR